LPETRSVEAVQAGHPRGTAGIQPKAVVRLVVLTFVGITAFSAFETTFALLADDRLAITESGIALVFAGLGLVLVAVQGAMVGPITERLGETNAIRLGLALNTVGFAAISTANGWAQLAPGLVVLVVGQGILTPTLSSAVAGSTSPDRAGSALGFQQSAGGLARVAGPLMGGALFAISTPAPYLVAAGMTLAALRLVPAADPV
jgi:MFS family permease